MARKFALLSFTVLFFKLNYKDSKRCVYDNYLRDDKNAKPTITLWKWLTACHKKNVEVYNENSLYTSTFSLYTSTSTFLFLGGPIYGNRASFKGAPQRLGSQLSQTALPPDPPLHHTDKRIELPIQFEFTFVARHFHSKNNWLGENC